MKKLLLILATIVAFTSCTTVDTTEVGIKYYKWSADDNLKGGVQGTVKGFVLFNPITQSVFKYPIELQRLEYEPFTINAKGGSEFTMTPNLAYNINPDRAIDIFVKYRKPVRDIEAGFIKTCIFEAYRIVANRYTPDELMNNLERFYADVRTHLDESMGSEGFIVNEFTTAIDPPESLKQSILAKETAVQKSIQIQNEIDQTRATAEKEIVAAEGKAKALKIEADAEAYYNRTVSASLNENLIRQYAIEKWSGVTPYVSGGQNVPIIDFGNIFK